MFRSVPDRRKTPIGTFLQPTRTPPRLVGAARMNNTVRTPEHLLTRSIPGRLLLLLQIIAYHCTQSYFVQSLTLQHPYNEKDPILLFTRLPRRGLLGN